MGGVLSRPLNQDLEDELPGSGTIGKLREDFGAYSSASGSEEVAILLHLPPMPGRGKHFRNSQAIKRGKT